MATQNTNSIASNQTYLNRDFNSIREDLMNLLKVYYPEQYQDFNAVSIGMSLVDLMGGRVADDGRRPADRHITIRASAIQPGVRGQPQPCRSDVTRPDLRRIQRRNIRSDKGEQGHERRVIGRCE